MALPTLPSGWKDGASHPRLTSSVTDLQDLGGPSQSPPPGVGGQFCLESPCSAKANSVLAGAESPCLDLGGAQGGGWSGAITPPSLCVCLTAPCSLLLSLGPRHPYLHPPCRVPQQHICCAPSAVSSRGLSCTRTLALPGAQPAVRLLPWFHSSSPLATPSRLPFAGVPGSTPQSQVLGSSPPCVPR